MNTAKFALVIGLPDNETFGYLIIASYGTYVFGAVCFVVYVLRNKRRNSWTVYNET